MNSLVVALSGLAFTSAFAARQSATTSVWPFWQATYSGGAAVAARGTWFTLAFPRRSAL